MDPLRRHPLCWAHVDGHLLRGDHFIPLEHIQRGMHAFRQMLFQQRQAHFRFNRHSGRTRPVRHHGRDTLPAVPYAEFHAGERLALCILRQQAQFAFRLVYHRQLPLRHGDERLRIEDEPLRGRLLAEVEIDTGGQRERERRIAGPQAHRLKRVKRVRPGRQFPLPGKDIDAEDSTREVFDFALLPVPAQRRTADVQHGRPRARLRSHTRHVDIVSPACFLCGTAAGHKAKKQRHGARRHSLHDFSPFTLYRTAAGILCSR